MSNSHYTTTHTKPAAAATIDNAEKIHAAETLKFILGPSDFFTGRPGQDRIDDLIDDLSDTGAELGGLISAADFASDTGAFTDPDRAITPEKSTTLKRIIEMNTITSSPLRNHISLMTPGHRTSYRISQLNSQTTNKN